MVLWPWTDWLTLCKTFLELRDSLSFGTLAPNKENQTIEHLTDLKCWHLAEYKKKNSWRICIRRRDPVILLKQNWAWEEQAIETLLGEWFDTEEKWSEILEVKLEDRLVCIKRYQIKAIGTTILHLSIGTFLFQLLIST